ncbi:MAG: type II secretion system major pseudopilin GspG [Pseudomonadota bacterium]
MLVHNRTRDRRRQRRTSDPEAGFTLLEVLVVLVIVVMLASFVGPRVVGYLSSSRAKAAKVQIEGFATALELYRMDVGRYPTPEEGLGALVQKPSNADAWNGPYLRKTAVPKDPWGNPYVLQKAPTGQPYLIVSHGSDGKPGGDGDAADITNTE